MTLHRQQLLSFFGRKIVLHRRRPEHLARNPVHIVLQIRPEVGSLRTPERLLSIKRSFRDGCERFGMRLLEFTIRELQIHLVVEAEDKRALSRGIQGLAVRLARGINKVSQRKGKVFAERYDSRPLQTVVAVRNTMSYLFERLPKRRHPAHLDPFSSAASEACWWDDSTRVVAPPRTWLFLEACEAALIALAV